MSEKPTLAADVSPEEALRKVEEATAAAEKQLGRAKKQFAYSVQLAETRLAYAEKQLEEARAMRDRLLEHQDDPEGARHLASIQALGTVFGATKRMMEIELACHRHNLAQVTAFDVKVPGAKVDLRYPQEDLGYLEAKAFMDVHMAIIQVTEHLDGVDMVLRATEGQAAVVPASDDEMIARRMRASQLRAAMAQNDELAILVNQLSGELQETMALLEWGKSALANASQLPPIARKGLFEDADWSRLNGRVVYLQGMPTRARLHPELAPYFTESETATLPFDPVSWAATETVGTGPLLG
ncbi:hypothetical protein D3C72_340710 [compost metagenome]